MNLPRTKFRISINLFSPHSFLPILLLFPFRQFRQGIHPGGKLKSALLHNIDDTKVSWHVEEATYSNDLCPRL
jgi:hypothetical protein